MFSTILIIVFITGREYDKYGNMHQWWNNKTIDRFKEQAECVVNQYSSYQMNNKRINGKQTLGVHYLFFKHFSL